MSKKQSKPQNPLWQTTKPERKSYYTYFFGQNMIYNMIAGYLTTFLLLIGVDPVKSAAVMLVVKVWDAVNDAIFGVVFDKIKELPNGKIMWHFKRLNGAGYAWFDSEVVKEVLSKTTENVSRITR